MRFCRLQQHDPRFPAALHRLVVPHARLYLADMRAADEQHAQAGLADAAADGQRQFAVEQRFMELSEKGEI